MITHGKHVIDYVLSVSNGRSAGPVAAGNTIIISNVIPVGMTDLTVHAKSSAWKVKLASKIGPSILTATYVGAYPVLAGASLVPILVHGILKYPPTRHLFLPAVVRLLHSDNSTKSSAKLLQQQSAHEFTVQRVTSRAVTPLANPTYQAGQTVAYTLAISNGNAAGSLITGDTITVTDSIPAGLTGLTASATNSDWTVSLGAATSPTTLTATYIGAYPVLPGASFSPIILVGTLTSPAVPQVVNSAVVVTPNDNNAANNTGTNTINVIASPDLTVTDPVPTGTYQVGKAITYTVTGSSLGSAGPVQAGDAITITDTIPTGLTGITTSATSGWTFSLSPAGGTSPATLTATYTGTYPVVAGTTLPAITITGTLTSTAVSSLLNTATISTPNDSNAANNTASNTITVVVQPDLTVTKTAPTGITYQVGGPITYTITASNASGAGSVFAGDAITVTDSIPTGLTSLTASGTNWTTSLSTTTSPSTLTATYTGAYPVAAGANLPAISLTGTLTKSGLDLITSPVGYWSFDENSGTVAYDSSSNHNAGTLTGGPTWTTGAVNSGLSFNGTSSYVTMGNPSALQFGTGSFSAMAWFKTTTTSGMMRIFNQGVGNFNGGFSIDVNATCGGCVAIVLGGSGTNATTLLAGTTTTFSDGNWHQAAVVIDRTANTAQLYVDGVAQSLTSSLCGTASGTTVNISACSNLNASTTDPFVVGAYTGASGTFQYFTGSVDEVRAYNIALSSAQIQTLYTTPPLTNTAVVTTPNDSTTANNSGSNTTSVVAAPDLTVTDPVPTGTYQVGKAITYTVTGSSLGSAGPVQAGDAITITDTIPTGLTGITASAASGWTFSLSPAGGTSPATLTATYTGTYPVVAGTTLPAITITGTLTSTAVSSLLNTATISTPKDSNAANNTASNTITVVIQPDLTMTKTVPAGTTFQVGKSVTYTLTVSDASGAGPVLTGDPITIVDTIPAGLTSLTASGTNWTTSLSTTTSPSTLTATYTGSYPVAAGTSLSAISLAGTLTTASLNGNPITAGYWPLDAGSGTTAYDSSPNHNNGTITGASWTTGKVNSALSFNGTSNYVSMGNPSALQFGTGSFTVMAWFKTSSTSFLSRIVSQGVGNWNNGFLIDTNTTCTGCVGGFIGTTTSTQANAVDFGTTTTFNDNNWHQAAMVVNRTTNIVQMYVDGVAQPLSTYSGTCGTASSTTLNIASCTSLTASTTDPFTLGAYHSGSTTVNYFTGSIDEVRAYNSALSSAQIQTLYTIDTPPTPVGYWPFDANIGTTAYDASSNHNNGILTGGPTWTTGTINSALTFNGTNYVTMGNLPALQFGAGSFTAMAWFKTTGTGGMARIINQGVGSWNGGFNIALNTYCTGCLSMSIGGNGSGNSAVQVEETSTAYNDGNWHMAAIVIDRTANTIQLYVDGVAQSLVIRSGTCETVAGTTVNIASCSSLTATTTDPFIVGAYIGASGSFQYFTGSVDEVRIYGSALSSAQVYNLYTMPFTNTAAVTTPNDSNFTNNGTINKIQVIAQPDLSATKTVALSPISLVREQAQRRRFRSALKAISQRRS